MAESRNFAALDWVIGEIEETLNLARQSLEAFVENPQDSTRIRFCLTHIHQVHGSLQMIEFFGAALLAEEMEAVSQAMMNGTVQKERDAQEVLMRAILQLPIYLEQTKNRRRDDPASLLPLLNDLRVARGAELLSESQFFSPDVSAAKRVRGTPNPLQSNDVQFRALAHKLHQMYQYSAAGLIKGVNVDENLRYLEKVFSRLFTLTSGTARQPLWDISLALVEGMDADQLDLSVSFKAVLRQLEKEIRVLVQYGTKALSSFPRDELIKNVLYYVARSSHSSSRIERLKQDFNLYDQLLDSGSNDSAYLMGPDPETIRTVVQALNEELSAIKEALEVELAHERDNAVADALPIMKRVADTLSVLGVSDLRSAVVDQADALEQAVAHDRLTPQILARAADQIVDVEQRLSIMAAAASEPSLAQQTPAQIQISQAQESVLREARNGLEQTKDSIIEYIASQWDSQHLVNVPRLLEDVRGGLTIIPLMRPAEILRACGAYIQHELLSGERTPEWGALDTLADAIASVEYFLERLSGNRDDADEMLLTLAEESVESLGYGVGKPFTKKASGEPLQPLSLVSNSDTAEASQDSGEMLIYDNVEMAAEPETLNDHAVANESAADVTPDVAAVDGTTELLPFVEAELVPAPEPELATATAEAHPADELDDEILEIFVEEAREVLENIDEFFPRWANDFNDSEALTEFRRAFHTLKGSGRMVGALDIGELAWSIESMLNRVLDGSVQPHQTQVALIGRVRRVLPSCIDAFEAKQPTPDLPKLHQLAAWGEAIAGGAQPQELLQDEDATVSASVYPADGLVDDDADESNAVLWEIFGTEARTHLAVVEEFVAEMEQAAPLYSPPSEAMQRALHTLKGSAHMADVHEVAELATPLERFAKELRTYQVSIDEDILQLIKDGAAYTHEALEQIRAGEQDITIARLSQYLARVAELRDRTVGPLIRQQEESKAAAVDPQLLSIFMAEEMKLLLDADDILRQWQQQPANPQRLPELVTEVHTLARGAQQANLPPMAVLGSQLAQVYDSLDGNLQGLSDNDFATLQQAHEVLLDMVDAVAAGQNLNEAPAELLQALSTLAETPTADIPLLTEEPSAAGEEPSAFTEEPSVFTDEASALEEPSALEEFSAFNNEELTLVPDEPYAYDAPSSGEYDVAGETGTADSSGWLGSDDTADAIEIGETINFDGLPDITTDDGYQEPVLDEGAGLPGAELSWQDDAAAAGDDGINSEWLAGDTVSDTPVDAANAGLQSAGEETPATEDNQEWQGVSLFAPENEFDLPLRPEERHAPLRTHATFDDMSTSQHTGSTEVFENVSDDGLQDSGVSVGEPDFGTVLDGGLPTDSVATPDSDENTSPEVADDFLVEEMGAEGDSLLSANDTSGQALNSDPNTLVGGLAAADEPASAESFATTDYEHESSAAYGGDADQSDAFDSSDIDPEIIEIFLEEAQELVEDVEQSVHDWSENWDLTSASEALKRALHTLKGGARLAGMVGVGNLAHDFETDVIRGADNHQIDNAFFARLNQYQDHILRGVEAVKSAMAGDGDLVAALLLQPGVIDSAQPSAATTEELSEPASELEQETPPAADETALAGEASGAEILPFTPRDNIPVVSSGDDFSVPARRSGSSPSGGGTNAVASPLQARRSAPQEVVKVSAELLEELVNLAGETSISRGRMEEQMSELGFAIEEMDATIGRLQEQLRRLDIETEAQILFRQEQLAELEDFDPLEMDRYSQLQQLSRSLIESASDLMDLKNTLSDKTRDTETLLLQQSRINTELQEGLMRSRMVPFSRMVPRLRRIVRQVASELNKRVNFELDNIEGEMDRTVLERMVAPLEHMLRNAVDHGIESPGERMAAGKPETGRVILTLGREGGDVVLRLIDDGRGINLERVRAKAIERGLMSAEARLSDSDVMQFILHAGFSTAESVTQISGRGVGMDVVNSEIKQLGGSMTINSRFGEGSEFVVRLPFTVSVNRALMVRIGEDRYAVPLNTIEGIVRVSPFELEHYYNNPDARFEYAGEQYQVRYLGTLLHSHARPKLEGQAMPLPVVLVRTAQNAVALQVDLLMGSREIVVKSLGAQFATVTGVSGATVMGDGSVVVILDPYAMIRQVAALAQMPETLLGEASAESVETVRKVLVVDDSVTVRKVTSRFLEREGYEVFTAKDGADAMVVLQDLVPDVMLLDIEMPRMDGFEVAKNVRSSSRLKDIPIIMITSRTGAKHRDRALGLGVNIYMGKPYQEDKLLENIRGVLGESVSGTGLQD